MIFLLFFEIGSGSDTTSLIRAQSIFALAWFHAIVQERRTYIPQGWCKFYEFSDGDLKAGLEVLNQLYKRMKRTTPSNQMCIEASLHARGEACKR